MMILPDEENLNAWSEDLTQKGVQMLRYRRSGILSPSLTEKIRQWTANIVHFNASNQTGFYHTMESVRFSSSCVLTEHLFPYSVPQTCSLWSAIKTRMQRSHWREKKSQWNLCRRMITVNNIYRNVMMENWSMPADRVVCIYNGVNPEVFSPRQSARNRLLSILGQEVNSPMILTSGRMEWQKGFDILLEALSGLRKCAWHLVMVGEGKLLPQLREQARNLNLSDRLHFLGHRKDLGTFLAGADIFVLPSRNEAIGFSLLEAMACRVASIGSAVGGVPEVLGDSEYGLLVPSENVRRLRQAIDRLLTDLPLRQNLADKGYKRIMDQFTLQQMVDKTLQVYEELL
jgi:glycosyltransferase involved in cell wall biosynthesis